ncbi:hypothetical protein L3X38_004527 [Prunus dulcis]|uniref:Uncharacterized protein n=1 Tax=Prunus dulcis TaxID=3755 RepID=A0AAD4ZP92_PRUDU|nr:hypothetical protein L3X38_004527 [Prunus dulcis]
MLSQLNVWLNDEVKLVEQGVQLRKRNRNISMWKITESSELMNKTMVVKTRLRMLDPMKAIPHDDMVKLMKFVWDGIRDQSKSLFSYRNGDRTALESEPDPVRVRHLADVGTNDLIALLYKAR